MNVLKQGGGLVNAAAHEVDAALAVGVHGDVCSVGGGDWQLGMGALGGEEGEVAQAC